MKKLFLLIPVLAFAIMANASIPELTKSTSLTLTAASEGFSQSDNAKALIDGEWINWPDGTIHEGYAKWRVNVVNNGIYMVTLDMKCNNTYMFRTSVINPSTSETIATARSAKVDHNSGYSNTTEAGGSLNLVGLEAGEYYISVTDTIQWSEGKLRGITLTYVNGATIAIPATLQPADALLSSRAWVDKTGAIDSILFTPRGSEGYNDQEWAKWNVSVAKAGYYKFTAHVCRPNGSQKYEIKVLSADESSELLTHTDNSISTGTRTTTTNKVELATGNYVIKIRNTYNYAESRVLGIDATYEGGATTTIPATLVPEDALLSSRAWVDKTGAVDSILFTSRGSEGYNNQEWAKWKIKVTKAGRYNFTANTFRDDGGQKYEIKVLSSDEASELASHADNSMPSGSASISTGAVELAAGNYVVKVRNTYNYAKSRLLNVVASYAGGATIDIPETLVPADAILSTRAWVDKTGAVDSILFTPRGSEGYNDQEWAKWKIRVSEKSSYIFTANVSSSDGQYYKITVLNSSESETIGEKDGTGSSLSKGDKSFATDPIVLPVGEYVVKIVNTYNYSHGRVRNIAAIVAPPVSISETAEDLDDITNGETTDVQLTRSLNGGEYNTICLPFAVSAAEMARVFPGAKVKQLTSSSLEEDGYALYLNFSDASSMEAGKPYLINPAEDIDNPKFVGVTINKTLNSTSTDNADFIGTFIKQTIDGNVNNLFLGSDNKLQFSSADITIKGLRAYFTLKAGAGAPKRARLVMDEETVATDIGLIGGQLPEIFGNNVRKFIDDGQLLIVKDGAYYNAFGVKVR
ncbi:MAG: hypothetical protein IJT12_04325 [Paludibacteraceae bacterium]|nr:hypothetical protein [Paludibacteraceae bacterium]